MKKLGDIMKDLGFRADAPQSVKEAFIKNLIKSAYGVEVQTPTEKPHEPQQLSFDLDSLRASSLKSNSDDKKVS